MNLIGQSVTRVKLRNASLSEIESTQCVEISTFIRQKKKKKNCEGNVPVPK